MPQGTDFVIIPLYIPDKSFNERETVSFGLTMTTETWADC